jgi:hypothetical protein
MSWRKRANLTACVDDDRPDDIAVICGLASRVFTRLA